MRISRAEENFIGVCRPAHQGRIKIGFQSDGRITAVDLFIVQNNGPNSGGGDYNSAGGAMSIVYTPLAMRFRGVPVLTNNTAHGGPEGAGAEPTGLRCRTDSRQGGPPAGYRSRNPFDGSTRRTTVPGTVLTRVRSQAHFNVRRSTLGRSNSTGRPGVRAVDSGVARRSPASRSARRTTRPGITDSTGSCASHRTESCTSTPAWGTWVRIRTPARPGSPRRCSVTTGRTSRSSVATPAEIFPGLRIRAGATLPSRSPAPITPQP